MQKVYDLPLVHVPGLGAQMSPPQPPLLDPLLLLELLLLDPLLEPLDPELEPIPLEPPELEPNWSTFRLGRNGEAVRW